MGLERDARRVRATVEWPTLALTCATYLLWLAAIFWVAAWSLPVAVLLAGVAIAQHSSLQHEVIHGHPFRARWLNEALVWPALSLVVPYARFRDTHLAHHTDSRLTDPYDDPESNYLGARDWDALPVWGKALRRANNTLAGRLMLGPAIGQWAFMRADLRTADRRVALAWLAHLPAALAVLALVWLSAMPVWAYLAAVYLGLALLKIRTFLEHRADSVARGRSVIVEDRGPLALLFLNNNYHAVHHMHPRVAWYRLPALYRARQARFLACNGGYVYRSYGDVFRQYFWRGKDPVAHPLWHHEDAGAELDA